MIILLLFSISLAGCTSRVSDKQMTLDLSYGQRVGKYTGEVVNDIPNGNGTFNTKNDKGDPWFYEGSFKNGHFDGQGKCVWTGTNNRREEGIYSNDKMNGQGTMYINDKLAYDGNWADGTPNGQGKAYGEDGLLFFEGNFENGHPMLPSVGLNQDVSFADWTYKVTSVSEQNSMGNHQAKGIYLVVTITATNNAKAPRTLDSLFGLLDSQGRTFNIDAEGMLQDKLSHPHSAWYLGSISPSMTEQDINFIFDIPKNTKTIKLLPNEGAGRANPILVKE